MVIHHTSTWWFLYPAGDKLCWGTETSHSRFVSTCFNLIVSHQVTNMKGIMTMNHTTAPNHWVENCHVLDWLHWSDIAFRGSIRPADHGRTLWMKVTDYIMIYLSWADERVTAKPDRLGCVKLYELTGNQNESGKGQGLFQWVFLANSWGLVLATKLKQHRTCFNCSCIKIQK